MSEINPHEPTPAADTCGSERLLAELTDEFLQRHRAGQRPSVDDYASRHPPLASRILELFPVLVAMEDRGALPTAAPGAERLGATVGRYKLLERIGEGGFGIVYMAEQLTPVRRKVALKVIKPGYDTRQVIARFEAERQALALMDHENIAKVLDAGATDSGRPYFVMELVHGVPITEYCDKNQLPPRERLELFVQVCRAVQHAHTKGIIHRDIKPTNVLVTLHEGVGVPKVIDFGIAKATGQQLTDKTLFTNFAQMVGTPLYMSPEQAEMNSVDVDTRSDIYSLGVLLYELLTGTTPLDKERLKQAAFDEVRRIIREEDPPRPSTRLSTLGEQAKTISARRKSDPAQLGRLVRGELDWIVMKALEKDRRQRYETATGLARDIERYLRDEPVEACPPSAGYRFRKFARRNKTALAAAGLVLFVLASLAGAAGWVASQHAAQRRALVADIVADLDEVRNFCGQDRLSDAKTVLSHAEALAARGKVDKDLGGRVAELRKDVEMAYQLETIRLDQSAVQGEGFNWKGAALRYAQAFRDHGLDLDQLEPDTVASRINGSAIRRQLLAALHDWQLSQFGRKEGRLLAVLTRADANPWRGQLRVAFVNEDLKALSELARSAPAQPPADAALLGKALAHTEDWTAAVNCLRRAQQEHAGDFWLNEVLGLALTMSDAPRFAEAAEYLRAAVALRPDSAGAWYNLGIAIQKQGDLPRAIEAYQKSIALKPDYASVHLELANCLADQNDLPGAIAMYHKAMALKPDYAAIHYNLGTVLSQQGDLPGAAAAYRKAIALEPDYASAHENLGIVLKEQGDLPGALAASEKAVALRPNNANPHYSLGNVLYKKRDLPGAAAEYRKAIALDASFALPHAALGDLLKEQGDIEGLREMRRGYDLSSSDPRSRKHLPVMLKRLASAYVYWRLRDKATAESVMADLWAKPSPEFLDCLNVEAYYLRRDRKLEQARELRADVVSRAKAFLHPGDPRRIKYQSDHFQLLLAMYRYEEAEAVAKDALESFGSGEATSRLAMLRSLAELYRQWNKPQEAKRYQKLAESAAAATQAATRPATAQTRPTTRLSPTSLPN